MRPRDRSGERKNPPADFHRLRQLGARARYCSRLNRKRPLQEKYKALELERAGPAHKLRLVEADGGSNVVTLSVLWFIQH